jgi:hypothetical protein
MKFRIFAEVTLLLIIYAKLSFQHKESTCRFTKTVTFAPLIQ